MHSIPTSAPPANSASSASSASSGAAPGPACSTTAGASEKPLVESLTCTPEPEPHPFSTSRQYSLGQSRSRSQKAIIVMGGSFNPVHNGHIDAMRAAKDAMERQGTKIDAGYMAVAPDGYVKAKCGDAETIPAKHRLALCNAAAVAEGWIQPSTRTYEVASMLANRLKGMASVVMVAGSDKMIMGTSGGTEGHLSYFYVSREASGSDGAGGLGSNGLHPAVRPGLSSSLVRQRLRTADSAERAVRELMSQGIISFAVGQEILEARMASLRKHVPLLFVDGGADVKRAAYEARKLAKDAARATSEKPVVQAARKHGSIRLADKG